MPGEHNQEVEPSDRRYQKELVVEVEKKVAELKRETEEIMDEQAATLDEDTLRRAYHSLAGPDTDVEPGTVEYELAYAEQVLGEDPEDPKVQQQAAVRVAYQRYSNRLRKFVDELDVELRDDLGLNVNQRLAVGLWTFKKAAGDHTDIVIQRFLELDHESGVAESDPAGNYL